MTFKTYPSLLLEQALPTSGVDITVPNTVQLRIAILDVQVTPTITNAAQIYGGVTPRGGTIKAMGDVSVSANGGQIGGSIVIVCRGGDSYRFVKNGASGVTETFVRYSYIDL